MSERILVSARQSVNPPIQLIVQHHVEEIKKEIEKEFREVLENNIINPYTENILYGKNFVFKYIGTARHKDTIHVKFRVYRRYELEKKRKRPYALGIIIIVVNKTS